MTATKKPALKRLVLQRSGRYYPKLPRNRQKADSSDILIKLWELQSCPQITASWIRKMFVVPETYRRHYILDRKIKEEMVVCIAFFSMIKSAYNEDIQHANKEKRDFRNKRQ